VSSLASSLSRTWVPGLWAVGLALLCSGCTQKDFPAEKAQGLMQDRPVHLDAEQVMLTGTQLDCGVQSELWDPPASVGEHTIAHLTAAGRQLKFDDDVMVGEPGYHQAYVQIRGDFPVLLADGPTIHEDGQYGRQVEGKLVVTVNHACFSDGLVLMGVRKGKFSQDALPVMHFSLENDGWHFDKVVH
jgi:hypothetical protein